MEVEIEKDNISSLESEENYLPSATIERKAIESKSTNKSNKSNNSLSSAIKYNKSIKSTIKSVNKSLSQNEAIFKWGNNQAKKIKDIYIEKLDSNKNYMEIISLKNKKFINQIGNKYSSYIDKKIPNKKYFQNVILNKEYKLITKRSKSELEIESFPKVNNENSFISNFNNQFYGLNSLNGLFLTEGNVKGEGNKI